jgi:hypothetical protein
MLPTAVKSLGTSKLKPRAALWHAHGLTDLLVAVHARALPIITGAIIAIIQIASMHQLPSLELIIDTTLELFLQLVNNFQHNKY